MRFNGFCLKKTVVNRPQSLYTKNASSCATSSNQTNHNASKSNKGEEKRLSFICPFDTWSNCSVKTLNKLIWTKKLIGNRWSMDQLVGLSMERLSVRWWLVNRWEYSDGLVGQWSVGVQSVERQSMSRWSVVVSWWWLGA